MTLTVSLQGVWTSAETVENGLASTTISVNNFGASPPPSPNASGTPGLRAECYSAKIVKDKQGKGAGNDVNHDLASMLRFYIRMTEHTLLGAKYGFGILLPLFKMDAEFKIQTPAGPIRFKADPFFMWDAFFAPLIPQRNLSPSLFLSTYFAIDAPTGDYDKKRLVSSGQNHCTYSPELSIPYITDIDFEVSSNVQIYVSSRDKTNNYKNGNDYDAPHLNTGNRAAVSPLGQAAVFFKPAPLSQRTFIKSSMHGIAPKLILSARTSRKLSKLRKKPYIKTPGS